METDVSCEQKKKNEKMNNWFIKVLKKLSKKLSIFFKKIEDLFILVSFLFFEKYATQFSYLCILLTIFTLRDIKLLEISQKQATLISIGVVFLSFADIFTKMSGDFTFLKEDYVDELFDLRSNLTNVRTQMSYFFTGKIFGLLGWGILIITPYFSMTFLDNLYIDEVSVSLIGVSAIFLSMIVSKVNEDMSKSSKKK